MRTFFPLAALAMLLAVPTAHAEDAITAAIRAGCDCKQTGVCICDHCLCADCPVLASVPSSQPMPTVRAAILAVRSSYAALWTRELANGTKVVIGVNCPAPQGGWTAADASERDGMRPGQYILVGTWRDGWVYVDGRLPVDATAAEIDAIRAAPQVVQQVQQPMRQVVYSQPTFSPIRSLMGGGSCGPGGCR